MMAGERSEAGGAREFVHVVHGIDTKSSKKSLVGFKQG